MPHYFRPKPAAKYASTSESTLAKRRMAGLPPSYSKIGNRIIYSQDDLDEWIRSERRLSTSDPGEAELRRADAEEEDEDAGEAGLTRPRHHAPRRCPTAVPGDQDAEEAEPCRRPAPAE
jgi:hypothetical protein